MRVMRVTWVTRVMRLMQSVQRSAWQFASGALGERAPHSGR